MSTLADRNFNPGNLRDVKTGSFRKFNSEHEGYAALLNDLQGKVTGNTRTSLRPDSTLHDFSLTYAPKSENDSRQYTINLANSLGISPDTKLSELGSRMTDFAQAVARNEGYTKAKGFTSKPTPRAPTAPVLSPTQRADIESQERTGATFASKTGGSVFSEAAKTLGNIPSSAFGFAKGSLDIINPVSTLRKLKDIAVGTKEFAEEKGGFGKAIGSIAKEVPKSLFEVVPEAARDLLKGDTEAAQRAIVNDPVGSILPFIIAAKGGAKVADVARTRARVKAFVKEPVTKRTIPETSTAFSDIVDTGISKLAGTVTKPVGRAFGAVTRKVGETTRFGVGQATGLSPRTVTTVSRFPEAFTREAITKTDRASVGQRVQSSLQRRIEALEELGPEYNPIRANPAPIRITPAFWDNAFKKNTGLEIKKGKLTPTTTSKIREASDVRALQKVYEFWLPTFRKGIITAEEFLNVRKDLAKASKFERELTKRKDVQKSAGQIRAELNATIRPKIEGLEALDKKFRTQTSELQTLRKGIVDRDGVITDAGLAKIANLTKNKPNLARQLETILPGITKQIEILQAVVDLERASGIKVGTYTRTALTGGAFIGGGIIPGVLTAILTSPKLAVSILRQKGLLQNSRAVQVVLDRLRDAGNAINQLPERTPTPASVFGGSRDAIPSR